MPPVAPAAPYLVRDGSCGAQSTPPRHLPWINATFFERGPRSDPERDPKSDPKSDHLSGPLSDQFRDHFRERFWEPNPGLLRRFGATSHFEAIPKVIPEVTPEVIPKVIQKSAPE